MRTGRIILVIVGALLTVIGFAAGVAGGATLLAHAALRDSAGYYTTPTERFQTDTPVLVGSAELRAGGPGAEDHPLGTARVQATAPGGEALFVGIGPRDEVAGWLAGSAYEEVVTVRYWPFDTDTDVVFGTRPVSPPEQQGFWVAADSGTGTRTLTWPVESGEWSLVVMNRDTGPGVAADLAVGTDTDLLLPAGAIAGGLGLLLLATGLVIMLVTLTRGGAGTGSPAPPPRTAAASRPTTPEGGAAPPGS